MENLNIIEILKVGLPGLVFLLSVLSFKLLTREQVKDNPSQIMLKSIKHFMYINIFLAVLTAGAPFIDKKYSTIQPVANNAIENRVFKIPVVMNEKLGKDEVRYCLNASYAERYLLIMDASSNSIIQVRASRGIPCNGKEEIQIGARDGFDLRNGRIEATVSVAYPGMKFIMGDEDEGGTT